MLNNLLDNALKFTPADGQVRVSLESEAGGALLRVCDTGIGIPAEAAEQIFKRFYQVDPARSGEEHGAGLGLQICKRIVGAHGGTIVARPNPDRGLTIEVRVPGLA